MKRRQLAAEHDRLVFLVMTLPMLQAACWLASMAICGPLHPFWRAR